MTQYNYVNAKLPNSQLNKLKSGIKDCPEVTLNLSSNVIGDSNNETNSLHKLLLTDRQDSSLHKTFGNNFSTSIKLSQTQLLKLVQSGRLLDKLIGPFLKVGLPLMKNILMLLGLTAAAATAAKNSWNRDTFRHITFASARLSTAKSTNNFKQRYMI